LLTPSFLPPLPGDETFLRPTSDGAPAGAVPPAAAVHRLDDELVLCDPTPGRCRYESRGLRPSPQLAQARGLRLLRHRLRPLSAEHLVPGPRLPHRPQRAGTQSGEVDPLRGRRGACDDDLLALPRRAAARPVRRRGGNLA